MADVGADLIRVSLALSAAVLLVMALRVPIRTLAGPRIAYGLWALIPLAILSAFIPAWAQLSFLRPAQLERPVLAAVSAVRSVASLVPAGLTAPTAASPLTAAPWLWLWLAGAMILLLRLAWLESRLAQRLTRLRADPLLGDVYYLDGQNLGPMVVGLWKARIILPADFPHRYEGEERELILAHERAHVLGGHLTAGGLAYLLLILQWFNPLAHVAIGLFRIDQELACDAAVVARYPDKRAAYARAMFKTGLAAVSGAAAPLACCWSSNPLRRRIAALRGESPGRTRRRLGAVLTVAAVVLGSATTYAAMAAPLARRAPLLAKVSALIPVAPRQNGEGGRRPVVASVSPSPQGGQVPPAAAEGETRAQINARNEALVEQYLQAFPAERTTGINLSRLESYLGTAEFQRMLESGRAAIAAEPRVAALDPNAGPFSFVVPNGANADDAARALGLADASGYGVDRSAPRGEIVMMMCNTAQTPASVRCR